MRQTNQLWTRVLSKSRKLGRGLAKGDTIVEVMISMAVLSIVIATTYSLSTRAFKSGLDSQYRDQAVSYGQQQLEFIKEADNNKPQSIGQYLPRSDGGTGPASGTAFCIDPQDKSAKTGPACNNIGNGQFTISTIYASSSKTFKVTTSWVSPSGTNQNTVVFYKPSDSYIGTSRACSPPVDLATCAPILTNVPAVGVSTDAPSPINVNTPFHVSWNSTNIRAGSCSAAGPGGFSNDSVPDNGTSASISLASEGTYTFTVTCYDNASNQVPGSVTVNVVKPVPAATTGTATSVTYNAATLNGTVNPNGFAATYVFNYGTTISYGSSTAAPSAGSGNSDVPASSNVNGLAFNTTYHFEVCATNTYGTTCGGDATFTTPDSPPPVINQFSSNQSTTLFTGQGVNRTFTIASSYATSCNINGTPEPTNGTSTVFWAYPYTTYRLTCSSPGGSAHSDIVFDYHETQVITIDNGFLCGWMYDWNPSSCSETTGLVQVVEGKVAITYGGVCQTFYEPYYGDYGNIPRAYGVGVDYNLGRDCNNY